MMLRGNIARLAKLLERDQPRVLVMVGAGISIGATKLCHASWLGLLEHGINHLVKTEVFTKSRGETLAGSLRRAFSPFDLRLALQHAENIEVNLKMPDVQTFGLWLEDAFRDFVPRAGRTETLDALRDLQQAGALLLTTNYDSLLSDACGLAAVTWEEHAEFLQVINRQREGILHVHGHWQRPGSVVLGPKSYDRITKDDKFQSLLRSLWLEWSWIYVGCGNGLDDPNLGMLLEWGKQWGQGALPHYFLAREDNASRLDVRTDGPTNLICVGYPDYADVSKILREMMPATRCSPFVRVDEDFLLFRSPHSAASIPFPSYQEYVDGDVPAFAADTDVRQRLDQRGWAFVLDVASVGKTTLALRIATEWQKRGHSVFYLDLACIDMPDRSVEAFSSLRRVSRPKSLLIIDNVHHQPELVRQLWDYWRDCPHDSKLLLVGTRMQRSVITTPSQDLAYFEHHPGNPAVELRPTQQDLKRVLQSIHKRVVGTCAGRLPDPPQRVLQEWYHHYGHALGAFCIAVLGRLGEFQHGNWILPVETAADWVREKWLSVLSSENRENLLCLAAFAAQELEMKVQLEALPYPSEIDPLLELGLAVKTEVGTFRQHQRFSLREPDWGQLILAAQRVEIDSERILFETVARDPFMAVVLSSRLRHNANSRQGTRLWAHLARSQDSIVRLSSYLPLSYFSSFVTDAERFQQREMAQRSWNALEDRLCVSSECLWETALGDVATFLNTAKRDGRNTEPLWQAIEREPAKLAERAWETPLHYVALFLSTARSHGRNVEPVWQAIEREPAKLAERVWEAPLAEITSFLHTAKGHGRNVEPLWQAIEREPAKLTERAWQAPLSSVALFLRTATDQGRNTESLWQAIESEPTRLADRAWETSLDMVASFLNMAKDHGRNVESLWQAIEREPAKLAERAWQTALHLVASFFRTAKDHGRSVEALWEAIEREPAKLAERAWQTPLSLTVSFLNTAIEHGRNVEPLWQAIECEPTKLAERIWETSLGETASFLNMAKQHGRNIEPLWQAIECESAKLIERAWESPLRVLNSFLQTAKQHGRDTGLLWQAIDRESTRLAERAWKTPLKDTASFLNTAKRHGWDTGLLWQAIEREPAKLGERMWRAQLGETASFLNTAKSHGQDIGPLWQIIRSEPVRLANKAWEASLGELGKFLAAARQHRWNIEPLWQAIECEPLKLAAKVRDATVPALAAFIQHATNNIARHAIAAINPNYWETISQSQSFAGAAWIAGRCEELGFHEHKSTLIRVLLQRSDPLDFPPSSSGLASAVWLLIRGPQVYDSPTDSLLDALCTNRWLDWQFTDEGCGPLATGLFMLGLHQPPEIARRFLNAALGIRLQREFAQFYQVSPERQSMKVELLGAAALCGWRVEDALLVNVSPTQLGKIPVDVLPHHTEASKIDKWQFQLWLGLRAFVATTGIALKIDVEVVDRTLRLWRVNLAESSHCEGSTEHKVNSEMVSWLQSCIQHHTGLLVPPE